MPVEYAMLLTASQPLAACPKCGERPFEAMLRGLVQRSKRWFWIGPRRPYCAVICSNCREIVGFEHPRRS